MSKARKSRCSSNKMEKWIEVDAAYDERKKGCGIHGVDLHFYLRGPNGAAQFVIYTSWHLPHVQTELDGRMLDSEFPYLQHKPMAADLGYHAYKRQYKGQTQLTKKCAVLHDKPCYYDGSGLNAETVFQDMLKRGHDAIWEALQETYEGIKA